VGYLERPEMVEKLKQALEQVGLPIYQVSRSHRRDPIPHRLEHFQVVADITESRRFQPDQVWFTTPSPVYYTEWFQEFLRQVPSERVVCFIPEGPRPEFFPEGGNSDRLVFGGTTFMAWQGNLEGGGGRREGVNFWRSPLNIPLVGTEKACQAVAPLLEQAGFRVSIGKPSSHQQASVTAVMTAFVAGLELAGWSLRAFRASPWLKSAAGAAREGILSQVTETNFFQQVLLGIPVLTAAFYLAAFWLPRMVPFDLEKYLKFHYLKTRDQTLALLDVFEKDGNKHSLTVSNIQLLRQRLLNSQ
jgi:hypothetical protein